MNDLNRAYALHKHRPLTLHATIKLPISNHEPRECIAGFFHLVNLYRPFDDRFVARRSGSRLCSDSLLKPCRAIWILPRVKLQI